MKKHFRNLRILVLLCFAMPGLAFGGMWQCSADGGTKNLDFAFKYTFTSPEENSHQTIMPSAYNWNIGSSYPATCECTPSGAYLRPNIFYTSSTNLAKGYTATVNETEMQFYKVNRNIQVAAEVYVAGKVLDYVPLPLAGFDNKGIEDNSLFYCQGKKAKLPHLSTGSKGRLHLMIDKPFIGESTIPRTKLFDLRGTLLNTSPTGATALVNVWMTGSVIVPQSCQLAPGQVTTIDFGNINPSDLAEPGETPQRSVSRTFKVQCKNISEMVAINLTLEGAPHAEQTNALAVNDRSDLAIVLKNNGRIVPPLREFATPKPENLIPLDFNQHDQKGEFDLEAYPIKAEKYVEPGEFKSQVTLKFEFE